jgi:hypothetical protein
MLTQKIIGKWKKVSDTCVTYFNCKMEGRKTEGRVDHDYLAGLFLGFFTEHYDRKRFCKYT